VSRAILTTNAANPAVYGDISPWCIGVMDHWSKPIRRAVDATATTIQNMSVNHCGTYILVGQEFLDRAD